MEIMFIIGLKIFTIILAFIVAVILESALFLTSFVIGLFLTGVVIQSFGVLSGILFFAVVASVFTFSQNYKKTEPQKRITCGILGYFCGILVFILISHFTAGKDHTDKILHLEQNQNHAEVYKFPTNDPFQTQNCILDLKNITLFDDQKTPALTQGSADFKPVMIISNGNTKNKIENWILDQRNITVEIHQKKTTIESTLKILDWTNFKKHACKTH